MSVIVSINIKKTMFCIIQLEIAVCFRSVLDGSCWDKTSESSLESKTAPTRNLKWVCHIDDESESRTACDFCLQRGA
jgi:hypothetical protein